MRSSAMVNRRRFTGGAASTVAFTVAFGAAVPVAAFPLFASFTLFAAPPLESVSVVVAWLTRGLLAGGGSSAERSMEMSTGSLAAGSTAEGSC